MLLCDIVSMLVVISSNFSKLRDSSSHLSYTVALTKSILEVYSLQKIYNFRKYFISVLVLFIGRKR